MPSAPPTPPTTALHELLANLVDYAGLFPPAKLSMVDAVRQYAQHRAGPHAWGLSRFILSAARLTEFAAAAAPHLAEIPEEESSPPDPWTLSVLVDGKLDETLALINKFNADHEAGGGNGNSNGHAHHNGNGQAHKHAHSAIVDTVEIKVQSIDTIDYAMDRLPEELYPFFEIPLDGDFRGFATCLAGTGNGAKIRTGGVVPEAFPPSELIADFLLAMHAAEVPLKATAGLHHPIRSSQPLTYEPGSACTTMHGFLNVFTAAAMHYTLNLNRDALVQILNETAPDAFRFDGESLTWRGLKISTEQVRSARENFAICFGSCSFDDPINDLHKLGLL